MGKKLVWAVTIAVLVGLGVWIAIDPAWLDIWAFNKEIIMTKIAKAIPSTLVIVVIWSLLDNILDSLYQGSWLNRWADKMFRKK